MIFCNTFASNQPMKYLAFILSLYILVLIAVPCIDVPQDESAHKIEHAGDSSHHHENETDHCSPFCTCYCCAVNAEVPFVSVAVDCLAFTQFNYSEYQLSFSLSPYATIWQPPQLS